jgi:hypothetical protein
MQAARYLLLIVSLLIHAGCYRAYTPVEEPLTEHAQLTFKASDLDDPFLLLGQRHLRMHLYESSDASYSEKEGVKRKYIGTVRLTDAESMRTVKVPSGRYVYSLISYTSKVAGQTTYCEPQLCFKPETGKQYEIRFFVNPTACKIMFLDIDSHLELYTNTWSSCDKQIQKTVSRKASRTHSTKDGNPGESQQTSK